MYFFVDLYITCCYFPKGKVGSHVQQFRGLRSLQAPALGVSLPATNTFGCAVAVVCWRPLYPKTCHLFGAMVLETLKIDKQTHLFMNHSYILITDHLQHVRQIPKKNYCSEAHVVRWNWSEVIIFTSLKIAVLITSLSCKAEKRNHTDQSTCQRCDVIAFKNSHVIRCSLLT